MKFLTVERKGLLEMIFFGFPLEEISFSLRQREILILSDKNALRTRRLLLRYLSHSKRQRFFQIIGVVASLSFFHSTSVHALWKCANFSKKNNGLRFVLR